MLTALVFDIDSTLTPPRQPVNREMTEALQRLSVPFYVAAGSHLGLLQGQFFDPLYEYGYRGQFEAFVSNGAIHYHCDYSGRKNLELVAEFVISEHLGPDDFNFLMDILDEALSDENFRLPPNIRVVENRIVDRRSMVNLCPMGRKDTEGPEAVENRRAFVTFDEKTGYRQKILKALYMRLDRLVRDRGLKITLGGQTSFDIGVKGQDKTRPVRKLVSGGYGRILFIGDALFPGGNDEVIMKYIEDWPKGEPCPVEAIQVNNWRQTLSVLESNNFLSD